MNASTPLYLSVKQVTAQFGYSRATVHRKLSKGLFHGKKDGCITLGDNAASTISASWWRSCAAQVDDSTLRKPCTVASAVAIPM